MRKGLQLSFMMKDLWSYLPFAQHRESKKRVMKTIKSALRLAHTSHRSYHSVYINIVPHKALTTVLISKSLAELAAEGS